MKQFSLIFVFLFALSWGALGQTQDQLPVREYTNPEEVVTFDRTTPFSRALDVINEFSQEYRGKMIVDRSGTSGELGISIPAMHWMDALKMILNVKQLHLVEKPEFYEIYSLEQLRKQDAATGGQAQQVQQQVGADGEGPVATIGTREVRINAIFFEGNRRALREIGVDWSTLSNNVPEDVLDYTGSQQQGGGGGGGGGGQQRGQLPSQTFDGPFVQVNTKGAQSVSQNVFNALVNVGQIGNTGIEVQALFSAFEADNLGEILASPTVKVMDGEMGRIQVGQDFSIKQRDFAGNVTDEFFSVGTILEVTPRIIEHNDTTFIHLELSAERSSAQPDPVSTIINKQEAETQSLLLDGEATVIAGLYRTERSEVRRGVPILKDLPGWFFGLRYLFGFNSEDYQLSELVVLLQASIEPSIPERYERGDFANKFELLRDERTRYRDEIQQREDVFNDNILDQEQYDLEDDSEEIEEGQQASEVEDTPEQEEVAEEEPEQIEKQKERKEDPVVADPEMQTQEIPLNFSEENKQEGQMEEEEDTVQTVEEPKAEEETEKTEEAQEEVSNGGMTYYIIGGSFGVERNAVQMRDMLLDEGFSATIIRDSASGMYLVTYRGFNDLQRAKTALADIRQYQNSDAWLYRAN